MDKKVKHDKYETDTWSILDMSYIRVWNIVTFVSRTLEASQIQINTVDAHTYSLMANIVNATGLTSN